MKAMGEILGGARGRGAITALTLGIAALTSNWSAQADDSQVSKLLVCAETVAPAGCDPSNAVAVIAMPASAKDAGCGVRGPELLAGSGVGVREGQYVKVACASKTAQAH
jgi:hypothetical protein